MIVIYERPLLLLTTVPGLEFAVLDELKRYKGCFSGGIVKWLRGRIYLFLEDTGCLGSIVHEARTVENVRVLFCAFDFMEESKKCIEDVFSGFCSEGMSFSVRVERLTKEIDKTSVELASEIGAYIQDSLDLPVSLDFPDIPFYVEYEAGIYRMGIEITHYGSLRDRPYRIFIHRSALNPIIASVICMLARGARLFLDPFCGSGTIPIECVSADSKMLAICSDVDAENIKGAKTNSGLYGSNIMFLVSDISKMPFRDGILFDAILTNPPFGLRERAIGGLRRVYHSLFDLAVGRLARNGKLIMLTARKDLVVRESKRRGLCLRKTVMLNEGGLLSRIFVFEKI